MRRASRADANRSYPDRMDEFQRKYRDKFEHTMRTAPYRKKRQETERKREGERFAIAPSHLIGDGSRHRVGPPSWPAYKRGLQDIRGASVLKSRNSSNHEGIRGE